MDNNKSTRLANKLFPVKEEYEIDILDIPAEKRKLNTETYDFTVSTIVEYISEKHIDIPMFQRGYVWNRAQASRLIESLIIQCPIPVVYLSQNPDETLSVIDGNQRLTSISLFLNDEFPLTGLATYPELDGFKFSELDPRFQRHIRNRTIRCIVILKDTHPQIKFDVFERLNTGSVKLNPQELRHGIYNGPLIEIIEELSNISQFKKATSTTNDKRMKGEEMILRFFALYDNWQDYQKPMTTYLNNYAENNRFFDQNSLERLEEIFKVNFNKCLELYGEYTFKTFDENKKRLKSNTALFDAQMISMSNINPPMEQLEKLNKEMVLEKLTELLGNEDFYDSLTKGTTDRNTVHKRIIEYTDFLGKILN
ncbi:MAG: DUF262 domain-containing protein [Cytophagales bacterium]|uniref:DUF262 domain-containing protein n=1 Tax=Cyclobacterium marinum TaxID=104 RepID=UPI0030DC0AF4|nr:DUF262 domain-containing protein [Cytophagales bacterium]|tara:strand:- start:37223 stop:38323 length:1101 start_codon:yes stop_codon:yes gene_type:complete